MKSKLINLLLLSIVSLCCLSVTEFFLRRCRCTPVPICTPSLSGFAHFPDRDDGRFTFRCNAQGYRGENFAYEKPKGTKRLLIIGDSHAFGAGVEDEQRFSQLLQQQLASNQEAAIEVINLALPAQSFLDYEEQLKEGLRYHPDIVLLAPYLGNDFIELQNDLSRPASEKPKSEQDDVAGVLRSWSASLASYHLVARVFHYFRQTSPQEVPEGISLQALSQRSAFEKDAQVPPKITRPALRIVRSLAKAIEKAKASFYILLLPTKDMLDRDWESGASAALSKAKLSSEELRSFNEASFAALNDAFCRISPYTIDAAQHYALSPRDKELYWPSDWHLNVEGHVFVATILEQCLFTGSETHADSRCQLACKQED